MFDPRVAVKWNERVSTYVYYDGQLARDECNSHNVNGGLTDQFPKKPFCELAWRRDLTKG